MATSEGFDILSSFDCTTDFDFDLDGFDPLAFVSEVVADQAHDLPSLDSSVTTDLTTIDTAMLQLSSWTSPAFQASEAAAKALSQEIECPSVASKNSLQLPLAFDELVINVAALAGDRFFTGELSSLFQNS
jgi:hypothetical protein